MNKSNLKILAPPVELPEDVGVGGGGEGGAEAVLEGGAEEEVEGGEEEEGEGEEEGEVAGGGQQGGAGALGEEGVR